MTLGERLNNYLSQLGQKQSAIATEWLERYTKQVPKARWEAETIISHLNRCLKEKREGVKFFFEHDAQRTDLLFELLRIPQSEHAELRALARECLDKEGEVNCRLVIDVTTWGASREQSEPLFDALKLSVLQPAEKLKLVPVVLVFSEEQFDFLPRSYDRLGEWLIREEVKDRQEAWTRIAKLAGDGALVVSSRQFQPIERWMAMEETPKKSLAFEPEHGLDTFAKTSRLPAPPVEVAHPLRNVATVDPNATAPVPKRPSDLRRLMLALADETQVPTLNLTKADRLALSHALGVPATSTERERLEHELAALATQVRAAPQKLTPEELAQLLARAKRRPVAYSLLRVGDELHALNPAPDLALPTHPRLKIHRHSSRTPAINRLMTVVDKWTADDYAADRGLLRVIESLDPKGEERLAFLHARACLLWSNGLCSPAIPAPLPDWKGGLSRLLAGNPPAAQLRFFVEQGAWPEGRLAPFIVLTEEPAMAALPLSAKLNADDPAIKLLSLAPLTSQPCMSRKQTAYVFDFYRRETERTDYRRQEAKTKFSFLAEHFSKGGVPDPYSPGRRRGTPIEYMTELEHFPSVLLPHSSQALRQQDLWLDLLDCSRAISGSSCDPESLTKVVREIREERLFPIQRVRFSSYELELPNGIWAQADQELALCWLALKNALAQGHAVRLHDGAVLLSMGAGLCARITIRRCETVKESSSEEQQVRGCLDAWARHGTRTAEQHTQSYWDGYLDHRQVTTHRATTTGYGNITATTALGYDLPELYLAGHGLRAEITFLTSPLLLSYGGMTPPIAAIAAAGTQALVEAQNDDHRKAEQAQRAAYDDDDDD